MYGILFGVNGFNTNLNMLPFDTQAFTATSSNSVVSSSVISKPASSASFLSMLPQYSKISNLFLS